MDELETSNYHELLYYKDHGLQTQFFDDEGTPTFILKCEDCDTILMRIVEEPVNPEAVYYVQLNDVYGVYVGNKLVKTADGDNDEQMDALDDFLGDRKAVFFDIYLDDVFVLPPTLREAEALAYRETVRYTERINDKI